MRREFIESVKRVVLKIGSGVLTVKGGLNLAVIDRITSEIALLKGRGIEFIMVSSGSIAAGLPKLGFRERPTSMAELQAAASVGQTSLMRSYERSFEGHGIVVGQILLTNRDLSYRHRFINAKNTIFALLELGVIPIINENDTVAVDEIRLGDNDFLAAQTINLVEADLLVLLTDTGGFYDKDPNIHDDARLISTVENIKEEISHLAADTSTAVGSGGMKTKIEAAKMAVEMGIPAVIGSGLEEKVIIDIFDAKEVGTFFLPKKEGMKSKKHWIRYSPKITGSIEVDGGAFEAIVNGGKSLLPGGIVAVTGKFKKKEIVSLTGPGGGEFARGQVNYDYYDLIEMKGKKRKDIREKWGDESPDEVIHRDNLVLIEK
jgi:glutamate 5-kinase